MKACSVEASNFIKTRFLLDRASLLLDFSVSCKHNCHGRYYHCGQHQSVVKYIESFENDPMLRQEKDFSVEHIFEHTTGNSEGVKPPLKLFGSACSADNCDYTSMCTSTAQFDSWENLWNCLTLSYIARIPLNTPSLLYDENVTGELAEVLAPLDLRLDIDADNIIHSSSGPLELDLLLNATGLCVVLSCMVSTMGEGCDPLPPANGSDTFSLDYDFGDPEMVRVIQFGYYRPRGE